METITFHKGDKWILTTREELYLLIHQILVQYLYYIFLMFYIKVTQFFSDFPGALIS